MLKRSMLSITTHVIVYGWNYVIFLRCSASDVTLGICHWSNVEWARTTWRESEDENRYDVVDLYVPVSLSLWLLLPWRRIHPCYYNSSAILLSPSSISKQPSRLLPSGLLGSTAPPGLACDSIAEQYLENILRHIKLFCHNKKKGRSVKRGWDGTCYIQINYP